MSCTNFDNCRKQESDKMGYPIDSNSLYGQKIYDNQTAASRCYAVQTPVQNRTNIVEGFGLNFFTWEKIIKIAIILLLIVLFVSLVCDYTQRGEGVQAGGLANDSYFELTAITELGE